MKKEKKKTTITWIKLIRPQKFDIIIWWKKENEKLQANDMNDNHGNAWNDFKCEQLKLFEHQNFHFVWEQENRKICLKYGMPECHANQSKINKMHWIIAFTLWCTIRKETRKLLSRTQFRIHLVIAFSLSKYDNKLTKAPSIFGFVRWTIFKNIYFPLHKIVIGVCIIANKTILRFFHSFVDIRALLEQHFHFFNSILVQWKTLKLMKYTIERQWSNRLNWFFFRNVKVRKEETMNDFSTWTFNSFQLIKSEMRFRNGKFSSFLLCFLLWRWQWLNFQSLLLCVPLVHVSGIDWTVNHTLWSKWLHLFYFFPFFSFHVSFLDNNWWMKT